MLEFQNALSSGDLSIRQQAIVTRRPCNVLLWDDLWSVTVHGLDVYSAETQAIRHIFGFGDVVFPESSVFRPTNRAAPRSLNGYVADIPFAATNRWIEHEGWNRRS